MSQQQSSPRLPISDEIYLANVARKHRERARIKADIANTQNRLQRSRSSGEKTFLQTKLSSLWRALVRV